MQKCIRIKDDLDYFKIDEFLEKYAAKSIFLVCGSSVSKLKISKYLQDLGDRLKVNITYFSSFTPNPLYEQVVEGVDRFLSSGSELIFAIGGGSAIDVAKAIKAFVNLDHSKSYLDQKIVSNNIPFIAMPTTAGTGSESTHFSVIYYKGNKLSISDNCLVPDLIILDSSTIISLPLYQKQVGFLDSLSHAIESFWSVQSTEESQNFSRKSLELILKNMNQYFFINNKNEKEDIDHRYEVNYSMLIASNYSGKAINIAKTTSAHAMSYKLTSMYNIAHGHAVAICLSKIWKYMMEHMENCTDPRGVGYLKNIFLELDNMFQKYGGSTKRAYEQFQDILSSFNLKNPSATRDDEYNLLVDSVNSQRLKNNPIFFSKDDLSILYHQILERR